MKKMLMLVLVLGMVTTANAGLLELSATGDNTAATVDLIGSGYTIATADQAFMVYADLSATSITMVYDGAGSAITDMVGMAANFEALLGLDAGSVKSAYMIELSDISEPFSLTNGQLVTSNTVGAGTVYLLNADGSVTLDTVTIIPEPATIALLCLGGLLIRKK